MRSPGSVKSPPGLLTPRDASSGRSVPSPFAGDPRSSRVPGSAGQKPSWVVRFRDWMAAMGRILVVLSMGSVCMEVLGKSLGVRVRLCRNNMHSRIGELNSGFVWALRSLRR